MEKMIKEGYSKASLRNLEDSFKYEGINETMQIYMDHDNGFHCVHERSNDKYRFINEYVIMPKKDYCNVVIMATIYNKANPKVPETTSYETTIKITETECSTFTRTAQSKKSIPEAVKYVNDFIKKNSDNFDENSLLTDVPIPNKKLIRVASTLLLILVLMSFISWALFIGLGLIHASVKAKKNSENASK